ncbi:hypothetical protein ACCT09_27375, partial [Rhizobium ruizarguesonis]
MKSWVAAWPSLSISVHSGGHAILGQVSWLDQLKASFRYNNGVYLASVGEEQFDTSSSGGAGCEQIAFEHDSFEVPMSRKMQVDKIAD